MKEGWSHFKLKIITEISNFLEFFVFIKENELRKMNFQLVKRQLWTHWEFCACHRIFGLRKDLSGWTICKRIINLLVKYIKISCLKWNNCLDFYIFEDSFDLENFFLFLFLWQLKLHFSLDVSIFTTIDDEKEGKSILQVFFKDFT